MDVIKKSKDFVRYRYRIILLVLITILIRIPRNGKLNGIDAFRVSWYAWSIVNNQAHYYLIHPASYFGAFTYSGYPILTSFILALVLFLTGNIYVSWYLTGFLIGLVGLSSYYKLMTYLKVSKNFRDFSTLLFVINPMFVSHSMASVSARSTFIAFFPLVILFSHKLLSDDKSIKNIIGFIFSFLLILLSHRVAFLFIPGVPILLILYLISFRISIAQFFSKVLDNISEKQLKIFTITTSSLILMTGFYSTFIFGYPAHLIGTTGFFKVEPGITAFIELIIDHSLKQGVSLVFASIFILYQSIYNFSIIKEFEKVIVMKGMYIISLLFLIPCFFVLPIAFYVGIIFPIPISILGAFALESLLFYNKRKNYNLSRLLIIISSIYSLTILFGLITFKPIINYGIVLYSLIILPIILFNWFNLHELNIKSKRNIKFIILGLLLLNITTTMYYTDTFNSIKAAPFPYSYVSEEEIEMANYISNLEFEGRMLSSYYLVGKRLMGLTGTMFYADDFGASGLISGFVQEERVLNNTELYPIGDWWKQYSIYDTHLYWYFDFIASQWWIVFEKPLTHPDNLALFSAENTQYIIIVKSLLVIKDDSVRYNMPLITSIIDDPYNVTAKIFETENMALYQIDSSIFA